MNAENMFIKNMYSVLCHIELIALFEKGLWYLFIIKSYITPDHL